MFQETGDLRKHKHKLEGCQGRAREGSWGEPKLTEDVLSCAKPQHRQVVFFKPTHYQLSVILDPQGKTKKKATSSPARHHTRKERDGRRREKILYSIDAQNP